MRKGSTGSGPGPDGGRRSSDGAGGSGRVSPAGEVEADRRAAGPAAEGVAASPEGQEGPALARDVELAPGLLADVAIELIEGAPDALVIHDGSVILYLNRRALELIGDPDPAAVVGQSVWSFLPQDERGPMRKRIERMIRTGERAPAREVQLLVDGKGSFWGEFVSSPVVIGGRTLIQTLIRDVTKRKHAEQARVESERKYRSLFDAVPVGLYRSRPDGTMLDANQAMVDMLGYPDLATLLATPVQELYMDPADRHRWLDEVEGTTEDTIHDIRLRAFDGEEVRARLSTRIQYDSDGTIDCFEGALEDITQSVRAEARFQFLFETMAQGVVFHDRDGRITVVNPAAERILGVSASELEGRSSRGAEWEAYYPDGSPWPAAEGPVSKALRERRPIPSGVMGIYNPERDEIRWIEIESYPLFGPDGEEVHEVYAVFSDVTERRQAEEELRLSERRLNRALTGSNLGLWDWSIATGELYLDARWFETLGYAPSELELDFDGWLEMVHPEDRDAARAALKRHLDGDEPYYENELRIRTSDGEWRWVLDRGQVTERADDGTPLRAAGTHTDITDRKEAEEALRRSEERNASMVRAAPLGITLSRVEDGRFLEVSDEFAGLVGYPRGEMLGVRSQTLGLWVDPSEREDAAEELRRNGQLRGFPVRFRTRDGDVRQVRMFTELLEVEGDLCALTMHQDVTESRRLEEQFRQAQKMEAVGRLAGGIAHDFNNLLTALVGHVTFLLDGLPEDGPLREEAEGIEASAERARRLTRQLLAFSRQQMLNPRLVDLGEVVESFQPLLDRLIGEDVILDVSHGNEPCWVEVDPGQLEQVVLNLAVNARDAMPDGGRLSIAVGCVEIGEPDASDRSDVTPPGRYAELTVTDTGVGMDEATIDRIFDPFYTTKPIGQGTGLGLSTVYGIIHQSSGHVSVISEPDGGTTFTILLPAETAEPDPAADPEPEPGGDEYEGSESVLLVEDEEAVRKLAVRVLERSGYVVHGAADGDEALALIGSVGPVELLVTDVVMPGMGGRELAERLRDEVPNVEVVYMSGYTADEAIRDREHRSGWFLEKPFTPTELVEMVRRALDG